MIYLTNSISKQTARFPRYSDNEGTGGWQLSFEQPQANITHLIARTEVTIERQYIDVSFRLPDVVSVGEYIYTLTRGTDVMAHGIAVIGDYHDERVTFDETNRIIQYGRYE